jgi:putative oxidoreductase
MLKLFEEESYQAWDFILLLLRITIGAAFIAYGLKHVIGIEGFATAFDQKFGFVMPTFLAYLSAWTELLGGVFVLLGLFTRIGGFFISFNMLVAALFVRIPSAFAEGATYLGLAGTWDKDLVYFAVGIVLMLANAGAYSLKEKLSEDSFIRKL